MFKVNIKKQERRQWHRSGVFIVDFELLLSVRNCLLNWKVTRLSFIIVWYFIYFGNDNFKLTFLEKKSSERIYFDFIVHKSQPTFTCSKSTIETLEKGVKLFRVNITPERCDVNDAKPFKILIFLTLWYDTNTLDFFYKQLRILSRTRVV